MASMTPNRFRQDILKAIHDLSSGAQNYKVLALNTSYAPSRSHAFASDLKTPTDYELSGTGYARLALTGRTVGINGSDQAYLDATDVVWAGINSGDIGCLAIIRDRGGADSANEVCFLIDNPNLTTNGGDVTVVWASQGIYLL